MSTQSSPPPVVGRNRAEPAGYRRVVRVWWAMQQAAKPRAGFGNPVWEGSFTGLVTRELNENQRYVTETRNDLIAMGTIRQIDARGRNGTTLELLRPPDLKTYETALRRRGSNAVRAAQRGTGTIDKQTARHKEAMLAWLRTQRANGATDDDIRTVIRRHLDLPLEAQRNRFPAMPCFGSHGGWHVCGPE
jgi:hypothetical protein